MIALSLMILKYMTNVKVFKYIGQRSWLRSQDQHIWYEKKHLITKNIHVKYKSPVSNGSKFMFKFADMQVKGHGQGHKYTTILIWTDRPHHKECTCEK